MEYMSTGYIAGEIDGHLLLVVYNKFQRSTPALMAARAFLTALGRQMEPLVRHRRAPYPCHSSLPAIEVLRPSSSTTTTSFPIVANNKQIVHTQRRSYQDENVAEATEKLLPISSNNSDSNLSVASPKLKISAPVVHMLKEVVDREVACFHFPGHNRGKAAPPLLSQFIGREMFLYDSGAIPQIDNLSTPKGILLEAQIKAAELFGSSETWFLVGGTTSGILASIMATCSPGETLILPRNARISVISGMVLSGAEPYYIMPEYNHHWGAAGGVTSSQIETAVEELQKIGRKPAAVLVTSPTYHGICSNIAEITKFCHSHHIPVIVDEAHGAHFRFHPGFPPTSLEQGADNIVVQSTHKVLSSLCQSSMLHMSGTLVDKEKISKCLQTLQSTSPSYLLLASLDASRAMLSENADNIFDEAMDLAIEAKAMISNISGISVLDLSSFASGFPDIDPLRLTVSVSQLGISGFEACDELSDGHGVISELVGSSSLTLVINLGTSSKDIEMLVSGLDQLSSTKLGKLGMNEFQHSFASDIHIPFANCNISLSPRVAFFAKKKRVGMKESLGYVSGELIWPYPPGIPALIPGDIISQESLEFLIEARNKGACIAGASDPQLSTVNVCDI